VFSGFTTIHIRISDYSKAMKNINCAVRHTTCTIQHKNNIDLSKVLMTSGIQNNDRKKIFFHLFSFFIGLRSTQSKQIFIDSHAISCNFPFCIIELCIHLYLSRWCLSVLGKCKWLFDLNHDWITCGYFIWLLEDLIWKQVIWFEFDLNCHDLICDLNKSQVSLSYLKLLLK